MSKFTDTKAPNSPQVPAAQKPIERRPMPEYTQHKKVHALKIGTVAVAADGTAMITPGEPGFDPFLVSADYIRQHNPQVGGYYVVYEDGTEAWAPGGAFEATHKGTAATQDSLHSSDKT